MVAQMQRARTPIPRDRAGPDPNVPTQAPAPAAPAPQIEQLAAAVAEWDKAWGDINDSNFQYIGTAGDNKVPYYAVIPTTVEALANPDGELQPEQRVLLCYPQQEKHGLVFARLKTIDKVTGSIDMWWVPTYAKNPVAGVPDVVAQPKTSLFLPNYELPGVE